MSPVWRWGGAVCAQFPMVQPDCGVLLNIGRDTCLEMPEIGEGMPYPTVGFKVAVVMKSLETSRADLPVYVDSGG